MFDGCAAESGTYKFVYAWGGGGGKKLKIEPPTQAVAKAMSLKLDPVAEGLAVVGCFGLVVIGGLFLKFLLCDENPSLPI
jgi:hypothetical protein